MKLFLVALLLVLLGAAGNAYAHPGGTDSRGGHYCRTNCPSWGYDYGEYHYHGGYAEPEPDYYDQGYEYGSQDAIDNNHDYIISRAQTSGTEDGRARGENGEGSELFPSAPDEVCEIEFEFRANEDQDYIDGVYDGWNDHCPDVADDAYSNAYSEAYDAAYAAYEQEIEAANNEESIDPEPASSNESSGGGWWVVLGIVGFFTIVGNWDSIKSWFKTRE